MLGQPVYFLTPDVVGVNLTGKLREGVTATDLVLTVTEMLRKAKVVGKFVEFFGEGTASLAVPDRATIANMAPEYGATMGFFPVDDEDHRILPRHRPHRRGGRCASRPTSRRRACSASRRRARSTTARSCRARPRPRSRPSLAGPEAPAGPHRARQRSRASSPSSSPQPRGRERLRQEARGPRQARHAPADGVDVGLGRRADRRDHLLHQHLEPGRAARRRPARQEGRREGPDGQAARQDLARARLARGDRVPDRRRACCRTSSSSASTSPATAAPPASATPARSTAVDRRGDRRRTTSSARAVLSGNRNFEARIHPNLKRQLPRLAAAGRRLRHRRHGAQGPDDRAGRHGQGRQAGLPGGHLADREGSRSDLMKFATDAEDVPAPVRRPRQGQPAVGRDLRGRRARSTTGRSRPTSPSRRSSTASA